MLKEDIIKKWEKDGLINFQDKVVVGVCGGPDSMCLLDLMLKCKEKFDLQIVVAHINHGIRIDSDEDEKYVVNYCDKNEIPVYVKKVDVADFAKINKIGLEEAGRKIRYDFFEEVLKKTNSNKIATAHNQNDVAETLLMNIFRGSGTNGLKSIEKIRDEKYIRPLLDIERNEIEKYCIENNLNPRIDSTNKDNTYTRNKIRNVVIPYLKKEFNPSIIQALSRLSEIATEEIRYIEKQTDIIYNELFISENEQKELILDLKKFNEQDLVIRKRIIFKCMQKIRGTAKGIEKKHIDDIIILCSNNIGNKYLIPQKDIKVSVRNKKLIFNTI